MKPELQRIAIAEAVGWTEIKERSNPYYEMTGDKPAGHHGNSHVPDYLNDLNAMHEAEKCLTAIQKLKYEQELLKICAGCYSRAIVATAAQRAEAFLRAIGKWEEGD